MGTTAVSSLYQARKDYTTLVEGGTGFHRPMEKRQSRGNGDMALINEIEELNKKLIKAQYDADYWRDKYDLLLKNLESQYEYTKYIETQVFGGVTK